MSQRGRNGEETDEEDESFIHSSSSDEVVEEEEDLKRIIPWTKQLTIRGVVASLVIGIIYSVIVMKLILTTGLVPNLTVSAALLAFVFVKTWTNVLKKLGFLTKPFTR